MSFAQVINMLKNTLNRVGKKKTGLKSLVFYIYENDLFKHAFHGNANFCW